MFKSDIEQIMLIVLVETWRLNFLNFIDNFSICLNCINIIKIWVL